MQIKLNYINGVAEATPKYFQFPDSQPHLMLELGDVNNLLSCEINTSINCPNDLFNVAMALDILKRTGRQITLNIFWLFGSRMDRPIDQNQPNTFKVVCDMIKTIADGVTINLLDIHNPKAVSFNFNEISIKPFVDQAINDFSPGCDIYFPDKGAADRYSCLFSENTNILRGGKLRDSLTGKLSGFCLESGERKSNDIIIIDDICDGGGTFLGQLQILKGLGYNMIALYTTTGIYSKGFEALSEFDALYFTNSFIFNSDSSQGLKLKCLSKKS